jgi:hypothetical protein
VLIDPIKPGPGNPAMRIGELSFTFLSIMAVLVVDAKGLSIVLPSEILSSSAVVLLIAVFTLRMPFFGWE